MNREEEKIDKLIRDALTAEEAAFYNELEEKDLFGKLGSVYQGKLGWLAIMITIIQLIIFVLFIMCVVRFLDAETTNELIKWGAGGFLSILSVTMLKLFIWMQMDKNDILREIKKLEFQLAAFSERSKA